MGNDLTVVNAARVSFQNHKEEMDEKDEKLIRYLAKHNHWTPFAHPQITLRIKAPVAIRTQFFKHKQGFVENEVSRRYVSSPPEIYTPKQWRQASENKKQGSAGAAERSPMRDHVYDYAIQKAIGCYNLLIADGICPEQARFVLPQAMFTEWYWTGSLAAYARFYKLRSSEDAQGEIQEYAEGIATIIRPLFPISWPALT